MAASRRSRPALRADASRNDDEIGELVDNPPGWLADWSEQVGARLQDGLRESPSYIVFARENGIVYHTYTVMAPDRFVAPYSSFLLDRTPKPQPEEPRSYRKDEYPEVAL